MKKVIFPLVVMTFFLACSDGKYKSADEVVELDVSFNDSNWDGKKVPKSGQCRNCGGEGLSPALLVKNIPKEADLLIVEFNDKSMPSLSRNGGHGAIRFQLSRKTEFSVQSITEQTFDLPQGVEMESAHRAPLGKPGAYMAPCGCGSNNKYEATIIAAKNEPPETRLLLGKGKIGLGRF